MPFKFTGDLKRVVIELGKSGLTGSNQKEIQDANARLGSVGD
jgi:hypothetical protein